ncbi:hypothetical protein AM380_20045 [Morganella morganii]|uniref:Uncharacterized protein n=1 Tax=Morganella morganii TaxID=582 RepID=A0AAU8ZSP8_MORMO|nr:hypothetical protein AM380_20045 [Morganella morganii]
MPSEFYIGNIDLSHISLMMGKITLSVDLFSFFSTSIRVEELCRKMGISKATYDPAHLTIASISFANKDLVCLAIFDIPLFLWHLKN